MYKASLYKNNNKHYSDWGKLCTNSKQFEHNKKFYTFEGLVAKI